MHRYRRALGRVMLWPFVLLLLVLPIVGVVVIVGASSGCNLGEARFRATRAQIAKLEMNIEAFRLDCGRLPDKLDELFGVEREPNCVKYPPRRSGVVDPFGTRFDYWRADDGIRFELRSAGPDRKHDTLDDFTANSVRWPRPAPDWPRLIAVLLPVLFFGALVFHLLAAAGKGLGLAWRRWHTLRHRGEKT